MRDAPFRILTLSDFRAGCWGTGMLCKQLAVGSIPIRSTIFRGVNVVGERYRVVRSKQFFDELSKAPKQVREDVKRAMDALDEACRRIPPEAGPDALVEEAARILGKPFIKARGIDFSLDDDTFPSVH